MNQSSIEWTDATWNPTRGCSLVSAGCTNCYAMRQAHRFSGKGQAYEGLTRLTSNGPVWTGDVRLAEDKLEEPLHWKKSRRIFVNSMSDLFHETLSDEDIDRVFAVMALCPQHIFQVLTKRPERMQRYMAEYVMGERRLGDALGERDSLATRLLVAKHGYGVEMGHRPPYSAPKHVHLGVSCEDQKTADERIPWLLKTPAAISWVSYEPALGPVDFTSIRIPLAGESFKTISALDETDELNKGQQRFRLDWIVCGGESGPGARPFDVQWARDVRDQCRAANVPFFMKQMGSRPVDICGTPCVDINSALCQCQNGTRWPIKLGDKKGGNWYEWEKDLRVRQFPSESHVNVTEGAER